MIAYDLKLIETERLILRQFQKTDYHNFFKYRSLPQVTRFHSFKPGNIDDVYNLFEGISEIVNVQNTWFQLAICLKDDDSLIGDIGLHFLEEDSQAEIGYTICPDFQGKGYAQEAVRAAVDYLFMDLGKRRIIASVDPNNFKSIQILNKMGMRKEAHFLRSYQSNGIWLDDCIYAMLKEEYIDQERI